MPDVQTRQGRPWTPDARLRFSMTRTHGAVLDEAIGCKINTMHDGMKHAVNTMFFERANSRRGESGSLRQGVMPRIVSFAATCSPAQGAPAGSLGSGVRGESGGIRCQSKDQREWQKGH